MPASFAPSTLAVTSKVFCNPLIVEREVPALHMYVTYSKEYCRLYAYELQQQNIVVCTPMNYSSQLSPFS